MRKALTTIMALAAVLLSSFASTTSYAADDDSDTINYTTTTETTDDAENNVDAGAKPLYYYKDLLFPVPIIPNCKYFSDLQDVDYYAALTIETLGQEGAFKGIVKQGKNFKPHKTFTRSQFKKIIKNLYGYKIKITNPSKACTADWVVQQLTKIGRDKFGINYKLPYKSITGKLDRIDVSILVYEFYGLTTGKVELPPF